MNVEKVLALYDRDQRIQITYPGTRKEVRPYVIRFVSESGGRHFILYSALAAEGADAEAVIAEEQAYFAPLGEVEWKVYGHDRPSDLRHRLARRGFQVDEAEALLALDLGAHHMREPALEPEVTVRRLDRPEQLADVRRVEEAVWGEEFAELTAQLGEDMAVPGYLSVYVAYVGEQPASAGWITFHPGSRFADLWGGSTLAEQRGRGLYTALLAARVREATARGYRYLTVDASPMSRPIVERHGFQLLTETWACTWAG